MISSGFHKRYVHDLLLRATTFRERALPWCPIDFFLPVAARESDLSDAFGPYLCYQNCQP